MINKGKLGAIILAIIIFGGLILGIACFERIPAGYVGVVYSAMNGVEDEAVFATELKDGVMFVSSEIFE